MSRLQTGYIPPDPRWPVPQSLLDKLTAAQPCARDLPASPWLSENHLPADMPDGEAAGTRRSACCRSA